MTTQHPLSETRVISIINAARAKAAAEGKTAPTYEEKFFALRSFQVILAMSVGLNPDLVTALMLLTRQLAPELSSEENRERNIRFKNAFDADFNDVSAGKVDMSEYYATVFGRNPNV